MRSLYRAGAARALLWGAGTLLAFAHALMRRGIISPPQSLPLMRLARVMQRRSLMIIICMRD